MSISKIQAAAPPFAGGRTQVQQQSPQLKFAAQGDTVKFGCKIPLPKAQFLEHVTGFLGTCFSTLSSCITAPIGLLGSGIGHISNFLTGLPLLGNLWHYTGGLALRLITGGRLG